MQSRSSSIAVVVACAAVSGALWWACSGRPASVASPETSAVIVAAHAAPAAPAHTPLARPTPAAAAVSSKPAASSPSSLASQVDQWSRSTDTRDAERAYDAVAKCLLARRREHQPSERFEGVPVSPETAAQICADLRSDQIQNRMQWLERAAKAAEKGAAGWFIQEGPSGNGVLQDLDTPTFDNDMTDDWLHRRDDYIDLALRHCDTGLEAYLTLFARGVPADPAAAQTYWLGRLVCHDTPQPTLAPLADDTLGQRLLQGLRHGPDGQRLPNS